jgi:hypothetical protein
MTEKERRKFQALTPEEVEEAMAKSKGAKDRLKTFYALLDDALWKKNKLKQYKEIVMTEEDEEFNRIEREAALRTAAVKATITKREWIGLTDEEMHECWGDPLTPLGMKHARMIEAKLKEKNT